MTVRVLICDDQALVRAGFRKLLEAIPDLEVVGEAEDGLQVVELARRRTPDVVLMDIRMPRLDGIEAARRIVADSGQAVKVLMLTTFGNDEYVYASLRAGASAFLLKDAPPEELVAAIKIVARGDALLAPAVTRAVIEAFVRSSPARPELAAVLSDLTPREAESSSCSPRDVPTPRSRTRSC
jgi:DNA-binding NarL/FixJ family response regulator